MPQSLSRVIVHLIFSTKGRAPWITEEIEGELYGYLVNALKADGNVPIKIGGFDDHVHILFGISRTVTIAKTVENIKSSSSKWMKTKQADFAWQLGYGAFSVSYFGTDEAVAYIANQREHHKVDSFQDEFRRLMEEHGILIDERYVWE
jgi:putative transposase